MRKIALSLALTVAAAASASAQTTNVIVSSAPDVNVPGDFVVNQIFIEFDNILSGNQARANLTSGTIYQDAVGAEIAPLAFVVGIVPSLGEDSFVTLGSFRSDSASTTNIFGGAVNLDGASTATFDASTIDIAWSPSGGADITSASPYEIAQFTFSTDTNGTLDILSAAGTDLGGTTFSFNVVNGVVTPIPEPGSLALLGLGGLALIARRRRNA